MHSHFFFLAYYIICITIFFDQLIAQLLFFRLLVSAITLPQTSFLIHITILNPCFYPQIIIEISITTCANSSSPANPLVPGKTNPATFGMSFTPSIQWSIKQKDALFAIARKKTKQEL